MKCFLLSTIMLVFLLSTTSCKKDNALPDTPLNPPANLYFPPTNSTAWQDTTPESMGWNTEAQATLLNYLSTHKTRAFVVLKDGKIVVEQYWGNTILNTGEFGPDSQWYWASAGKTLTALMVGIAQTEGHLHINDITSTYLGTGWTSMPPEQENNIRIRHQLTMTTGLDYTTEYLDCTSPNCLYYKAEAGTQWYYHNAPYTLLDEVISSATGKNYQSYTHEKVGNKIGMQGNWVKLGNNNVYWSTAREAARFGLLLLNKGTWQSTTVLQDTTYFKAMASSSQALNPSYGYLTWLNGKGSLVMPGSPASLPTSLAPDAPVDLFAAMGKNGQFIDVVPSKNLVVIRFGEAPDNSLVPAVFHNEMWKYIMEMVR